MNNEKIQRGMTYTIETLITSSLVYDCISRSVKLNIMVYKWD